MAIIVREQRESSQYEKVYIGIDGAGSATETIAKEAAGRLSEEFGLLINMGITSHQFFQDQSISFKENNTAMCFDFDLPIGSAARADEICWEIVHAACDSSADPGVCILTLRMEDDGLREDVATHAGRERKTKIKEAYRELIRFGQTAKRERVTLERALETAELFPEIILKSAYADQVNKEIDGIMQKYIEIRKTNKKYCFCSQYMAYLHKSGILSVLFLEEPDNEEGTIYHMYNIDVTTGLKADNTRMAAAAGVTDIRKAAMNAVAKLYRKNGWKIKDYKPAEKMSEANYQAVVNSFKEDRLNDNMMMGITDKGKLFFVSDIGGIYDDDGVSTDATFIYDADGKDLEYESNKNFVT